jgi:CubicO group peptidase (beta-lactamase class C family)
MRRMNRPHRFRLRAGPLLRHWVWPWLLLTAPLGAWAAQTATPSAEDLLAQDRAALDALPAATSALLQRHGEVMVELYARGANAQTLHDTRSAGKSVTGLLVAAAVQDGFLRRDTPVFAALADAQPLADDALVKRGIVVEDLLTMSSALDCDERRLFAPLGIATWQWSHSPSGETMTGGGLRLRTRDWASLAQLLLRQGLGPDGALLAPDQVAALLSVRRSTPFRMAYGELFWQRDYELRCGRVSAWMMSGNGGNHVLVLPTLDAVAVVTRTHYNQRGMHPQSFDFIVALLNRHVCGPEAGR